MDQICSKSGFPIKNRKSEYHHWILNVWISVGTKFQLQLIILIFWTKFAQKGYFHSETEKVRYQISASTDNFDFLDQICPKRVFPLKNKKIEQHHWILHHRIRLGAIFLGAMALLGQSRESWPSMALLGHVENSQMKMLWHF